MNAHLLERHFAIIGARTKLRTDTRRNRTSGVSIDIGTDRFGEFFDIAAGHHYVRLESWSKFVSDLYWNAELQK